MASPSQPPKTRSANDCHLGWQQGCQLDRWWGRWRGRRRRGQSATSNASSWTARRWWSRESIQPATRYHGSFYIPLGEPDQLPVGALQQQSAPGGELRDLARREDPVALGLVADGVGVRGLGEPFLGVAAAEGEAGHVAVVFAEDGGD